MGVPYTFGTATTSIPLSNLDANFNTPVTIGNATVGLGNTVTTVGNLTLTNATISSGNVTVTTGIFGAGTVSAPAITTTGDTNTGIFFPAADTIAFTEGGTESMRIDASGNLLVGTTANFSADKMCLNFTSAQNGLGIRDDSNSSSAFYTVYRNSANGVIGSVTRVGTTNAVSFNTSSDYRLKENIVPMTGALDKVAKLKPVTYTWKDCGIAAQGFIAHELQAVVPDCVTGEKDAVDAEGKPVYQGIDTSFLVGILTKAIQEQQALITQLQADVALLKGN